MPLVLISPSSRLQSLSQPAAKSHPSTLPPSFDIPTQRINQSLHYDDQDVVRELSIPPEHHSSSLRRYPPVNGPTFSQSAETSRFPFHYLQNVPSSLNVPQSRPRTPSVNFFSQHGLPSSLPPPPRTTFVAESSSSYQPESEPEPSDLVRILDSLLRGSYNTMLANPTDNNVAGADAPAIEKQGEAAIDYGFMLDDVLHSDVYADFLTSPQLDQSPETPFIDTPADEILSSPSMLEDGFFNYEGMPPPFGSIISQPKYEACAVPDVYVTPATPAIESFSESPFITSPLLNTATCLPDTSKVEPATPALPAFDGMFIMPETPALSPSLLYTPTYPSMHLPPNVSSSSAPTTTKPLRPTKALPTGIRRGITSSSLVPLSAPTQPRNYATPSATSRKLVPVAFKAKKRERSEVDGGDEERDDESSVDPNTKEAIEAKRRQNTLAARRSRQRKLEFTQELQESLTAMTQDRDMWMQRAYDAENKLRVHGIV